MAKILYCFNCGTSVETNSNICRNCFQIFSHHKANKSVIPFLGMISLVSWIFPIVGYPITVIGLILGTKEIKLRKTNILKFTLLIFIFSLLLTISNSVYSLILYNKKI